MSLPPGGLVRHALGRAGTRKERLCIAVQGCLCSNALASRLDESAGSRDSRVESEVDKAGVYGRSSIQSCHVGDDRCVTSTILGAQGNTISTGFGSLDTRKTCRD